MDMGASRWATLSITIFPKENKNDIYRKWVEKATYISYSIAIGKDFHYNRWRERKK